MFLNQNNFVFQKEKQEQDQQEERKFSSYIIEEDVGE